MMRFVTPSGCGASLLLALALLPADGAAQQQALGVEAHFQGYSFDEGSGADAAQLLLFPVAYRLPVGGSVLLDFYTAWAQGKVERDDAEFTLSGPVDTHLKLSWRAVPWAVLSVAANVPTGESSKTGEEAVVAAVLSSDLLGFREASWGTGFALTSGLATATRLGGWGIGAGASYRMANGFEPVADDTRRYEPGNEIRVRLGIDRNVGETGKLTVGGTFQNYSEDQYRGQNYFQAGNRVLVDASYAFRMAGETWTLFGADVWREHGDLSLPVDSAGVIVGDTTLVVGSQNLLVAGIAGAIPLGSVQRLRPTVDVRRVTRDNPEEGDVGSGWVLGVGASLPLRLGDAMTLNPRARYLHGSVVDEGGADLGMSGAEVGVTLRWTF